MQNMTDWIFYEDHSTASTPADMKPYINVQADVMSVEVSGTATSFVVKMQGRANKENNDTWFDLFTINLSNLNVGTDMSSTGVYEITLEGIKEVRANISSISGGSLTVFGRAVNTGV